MLSVNSQLGCKLLIEASFILVRLAELFLFIDTTSHIEFIVDVLDNLILLLATFVRHVRRSVKQLVNVMFVTLGNTTLVSLNFIHNFRSTILLSQIFEVLTAFVLLLSVFIVSISDRLLNFASIFFINLLLCNNIIESPLVLCFELLASIDFALHTLIVISSFNFVPCEFRLHLRKLLNVFLAFVVFVACVSDSLALNLHHQFFLHLGALLCKLILFVSLFVLERIEILLNDFIPLLLCHVRGLSGSFNG